MNNNSKRQGMAITSFVLGIVSVICFGIFAGIPAIILGHVAHRRALKVPERYGGGGLAIAGFALGYTSIFTTLILAGMLLPALAKAKSRAQSIQCVNNLKQVGLAFRIWASEHNDQFPFNAGTNVVAGGRVKAITGGASEMNEIEVLQMLANELGNPRVLICPADNAHRPAASLQSLQEDNVSYEFETGPEVTPNHPGEILARCPIHGNVLNCDGSVQMNRGRWH